MTTTFVQKPSVSHRRENGRGGKILTFGILSILGFGPIFGIPAWIMGRTDLRKITLGIIPLTERGITKGGLITGVIGTFISPASFLVYGLIFAIGLSMFTAQGVQENKEAILADIQQISILAQNHKTRSREASYRGFRLPEHLARNDNAAYRVQTAPRGELLIGAVSSQYPETGLVVALTSSGVLKDWQYLGYFAE